MKTLRSELLIALHLREDLSPDLSELIAQVLLVMGATYPPTCREFSQACRLIELVLVAAGDDPARPVH